MISKIYLSIVSAFLLLAHNPGRPIEFTPIQENQRSFQHEVTVTLKLVQVYVTDKNGNPVTDLEKADFQLFDNGKSVSITEFEKHILSLAGTNLPSKETIERLRVGESQPLMKRKFLLFFDFAFNDMRGILEAKRAALNFLSTKIHPDDEVGIMSFDTFNGLNLHEYFTAEHQKVREVIERFGAKEVLGRAQRIVKDDWQEREEEGIRLEKIREADKDIYRNQVKNFSADISELAKALRYIPGVKHIIFFSGGIVNSLLYGESSSQSNLKNILSGSVDSMGHASSVLRDIYEAMCKELAASNSPVYSVNTQGEVLTPHVMQSAMGDLSLRHLADLTGGVYFDNIVEHEKIAETIQNTTGSFYILGYYINEKWDGRFHKLKIRVNREGCRVLGQGGYFSPKPFLEYTDVERTLHLIDLALSEKHLLQDPARFPLITLSFSTEGKANLVAITNIPGEFVKNMAGAKMEVTVLFFDKNNNIVKMQKSEVHPSDLTTNHTYFYSLLSVPPGDYDCRVVIRNLVTGQGAVASAPAMIPEIRPSGFMLYPPLLLIPQESPRYLKGSDKTKEETTISLSDIYPFDITRYGPMIHELERGITKIRAVVRCFTKDLPQPEIRFSAYLKNLESEENNPLPLFVINQLKEQNHQIFLIEIQMGELQQGQYSLNLLGEEINSGSKSRINLTIMVK